jgi:hypothetical protein
LPSREAAKLFPQAADLGPTFIRPYATNGSVHYVFCQEAAPFGPENGYAKITFRLYGCTAEENGGWVIYLVRGADLSRYRQLGFLVRGEQGGEKIGIKAKDARGVEVLLLLDDTYLRKGQISTSWQEATVPLDHFGNVDLSLMDNFSIFTTGFFMGTRPQTVYLGQFELR